MADRPLGRSRGGFSPEMRSLLKHFENPDSFTGLDVAGNMILGADNRYAAFGTAGVTDSSIYFDGTSLTFKDSTTGTKTLAQLSAAASVTLDQAYDNGKLIDSSADTGAANAFSVGGAAADDKVEIYHNATQAHINARADDLYITAAGGDINFDNENLITTGTLGCGAITCQGITNTTAAIHSTMAVQVSADSTKLSVGASDDADSYLQWDATNLEIFSAAAIEFLTGGDTDDYMTLTTSGDVPTIGTTGNCNLKITASSGTIDFNDENLTTSGTLGCGAVTCQGITNTVALISSTLGFAIGANDINFTLGASGAADSKIFYNAVNGLTFFDDILNTNVTLSSLAGGALSAPVVTGDLTISDGKITWTDAVNEIAGTWTFSNVANDGIDIVENSLTTASAVHIQSTSLTSGSGLNITTNEGVGGGGHSGYYLNCYDSNGAATVFGVKKYGEVEITGAASTDILTITAGDVQLTAGDIDMDNGILTIDTAGDEQSYIKRNNATGTNAVCQIWEANATGGTTLLVNSDATDGNDAQQITHDGTGYGLSVIGTAATGKQALLRGPANQSASILYVDGLTAGWIGAATTGMVHVASNGALANATSSLLYSTYTGNTAAVVPTGVCGYFLENGTVAAGGGVIDVIATTANGVRIETKAAGRTNLTCVAGTTAAQTASMVSLNGTTGNGFIGASGVGQLHISNNKALAHAGASLLYSTYTGNTAAVVPNGSCAYFLENGTIAAGGYAVGIASTTGHGLKVINGATGTNVANFSAGIANMEASMIVIDGATNDWIGAATTGMIHVTCDAPVVADASLLRIASSGQPAAANDGVCIEVLESGAERATSYAVKISSTNNEALTIPAGKVNIVETLTASGGIISKHSDANCAAADTPTALELAAAFAFDTQGQFGTLDENNAATNVFLIVYDGANYWFLGMTKAV